MIYQAQRDINLDLGGSILIGDEVSDIQAGDVVVVYTSSKRSPAYGNHITLAIDTPDINGNFGTIEGNAKGLSCHGTQVEGVIQRLRNVEDVAAVYRPLDEDYS